MKTVILIALLFASLAPAQLVIQNDLPTPLFDGRADANSFDDFGSEAATCTPTDVTFVEDPPGSGRYAAVFNGTTSIMSCGTGLDGLAATGTRTIYVKPSSLGGGGFAFVYTKQTDSSNRSWQLFLDPDAGGDCTGGTGDCFNYVNVNTSNVARNHETPSGTLNYAGNYIHVTYVVRCTSTTVQSCDGTQAYINGFPVTMDHGTTTGTIRTADSGDTFYIGNRADGARAFDGRIKRTVVFSQELNKFQAEATYYRTLALDTAVIPEDFSLLPCNELNEEYWTAAGYDYSPFDLEADDAMIGEFCDPFGTGERPTERTETMTP